MVFGSQTKNRYKTILPNENSRVILEKESKLLMEMMENCCGGIPEVDEETLIDGLTKPSMLVAEEVPYINANYIKVSKTIPRQRFYIYFKKYNSFTFLFLTGSRLYFQMLHSHSRPFTEYNLRILANDLPEYQEIYQNI